VIVTHMHVIYFDQIHSILLTPPLPFLTVFSGFSFSVLFSHTHTHTHTHTHIYICVCIYI
jgi:hypothetical protein